jgi:hypothetical protein
VTANLVQFLWNYINAKTTMMKKIALMFLFSLMFFSCKKDKLIPENEIPDWLKTKISQDEQTNQNNPKYMTTYGVWLRYKWGNDNYFEYHNMVSSTFTKPISFNQDTLPFLYVDGNTDYYKEKCCRQYVWKGPRYKEY